MKRLPMKNVAWGFSLVLLITAVLVIGCASTKQYSGFLSDYSRLAPSPEVEGALYYQSPTKSLKDYDKFIVDRIVFHFHGSSKGKSIDPEELSKLASDFRQISIDTLKTDYQVVGSPGPGVLRIQAAITDLDRNTAVLNVLPTTKLTGLGIGGASMEARAIDTQTGATVLEVVDSRSGKRMTLDVKAGLTKWGSAEEVIKHWSNRFKARLDKAHGR